MKRKLIYLSIGMLAMVLVTHQGIAANPSSSTPSTTKVLKFNSLNITGEVSKPQVFYLLNRKKIQVRHRPEEKDLIKSLEKTLKEEPF